MKDLEYIHTWNGLLPLVVILIALYWLVKLALFVIDNAGKKSVSNKKLVHALRKVLILYKPLAIIIILMGFISINYITHSLLLLVIGVFAYNQIKNYVQGVFLMINPLIQHGAMIQIGDYQGEIKKMLLLGLVLNTDVGERFMTYSNIESQGFAISSNKNTVLRKALYLNSEKTKETVLDLLFDNPILKFQEPPVIRSTENETILTLQYTLEIGAESEDLIAFLNEQNITTSTTNTIKN